MVWPSSLQEIGAGVEWRLLFRQVAQGLVVGHQHGGHTFHFHRGQRLDHHPDLGQEAFVLRVVHHETDLIDGIFCRQWRGGFLAINPSRAHLGLPAQEIAEGFQMLLQFAGGFHDDFAGGLGVVLRFGTGEEDFHHVRVEVVLAFLLPAVDPEVGVVLAHEFQQLVARRGDNPHDLRGNLQLRERLLRAARRGVKSNVGILRPLEDAYFGILSRRRDEVAAIEFGVMADDDPERRGGEGRVEAPRQGVRIRQQGAEFCFQAVHWGEVCHTAKW
jgi:hypothetical protein